MGETAICQNAKFDANRRAVRMLNSYNIYVLLNMQAVGKYPGGRGAGGFTTPVKLCLVQNAVGGKNLPRIEMESESYDRDYSSMIFE